MAGVLNWDGILPFFNMRRETDEKSNIQWYAELEKYLQRNTINNIIVVARFDHIWEQAADHILLYKEKKLSVKNAEAAYEKELTTFLKHLSQNNRSVWIMEQVPRASVDPTIAARIDNDYSESLKPERHNKILNKIVKSLNRPNLHVFTAHNYFLHNGRVRFTTQNKLLYFDEDHLSVEGAFHIQNAFVPIFESWKRKVPVK